jgi:hypothetical protein
MREETLRKHSFRRSQRSTEAYLAPRECSLHRNRWRRIPCGREGPWNDRQQYVVYRSRKG